MTKMADMGGFSAASFSPLRGHLDISLTNININWIDIELTVRETVVQKCTSVINFSFQLFVQPLTRIGPASFIKIIRWS